MVSDRCRCRWCCMSNVSDDIIVDIICDVSVVECEDRVDRGMQLVLCRPPIHGGDNDGWDRQYHIAVRVDGRSIVQAKECVCSCAIHLRLQVKASNRALVHAIRYGAVDDLTIGAERWTDVHLCVSLSPEEDLKGRYFVRSCGWREQQ